MVSVLDDCLGLIRFSELASGVDVEDFDVGLNLRRHVNALGALAAMLGT
jgi:hypothetical protein